MAQLSLLDDATVTLRRKGANVAVLVDFDNAFPDGVATAQAVSSALNRILAHVVAFEPSLEFVDIRLYGGWLDDGVMTNQASELQAAIGDATDIFPMVHPVAKGLLRGRLDLITRLASLSAIEWRHTLRRRRGLPSVRLAEQPYPPGCIHESAACPVKQLQKFARRPTRSCHAPNCTVINREAFSVPEQKMVDVLLACDGLWLGSRGWSILVVSSDMDLLPAVAMIAATHASHVGLIRSVSDSAELYEQELLAIGVQIDDWASAL